MSRPIERAWLDEQRSRQASVALAAKNFYQTRRGALSGAIAKANLEICRSVTPERRADLEKRLTELYEQREELDRCWKCSSIRRAMEQNGETAFSVSPVEQRALATSHQNAVTPSAGPMRDSVTTGRQKTAKTIRGYAAKFNRWSQDLGGWKEQLSPGCFSEALKKSDPVCLFNHDSNLILGRTSACTLEVKEDRVGLFFTCSLLPFDSMAYGLARRIDRRDIHQCSFCFSLAEDEWKFAKNYGDLDERTVVKVAELFDVSPVTRPAYRDTACEVTFEEVTRSEPERSELGPERHAPALSQSQLSARANNYVRRYQSARWKWMDTHWKEIDIERRYCAAMGKSKKETEERVERLFEKSLNVEQMFRLP